MQDVDKVDRDSIIEAFKKLSRRVDLLANRVSVVEVRLETRQEAPPPDPLFDPRRYTVTIAHDVQKMPSRPVRGGCAELPYLVVYTATPEEAYEEVIGLLIQARENARIEGRPFPSPSDQTTL